MKARFVFAALAAAAACGGAAAQPAMKPGLWQAQMRIVEEGEEPVAIPATKFCLSAELARRQEVPVTQGDCTITRQSRSGTTMSVNFTCSNPKSTGETVVKFTGPDAYNSKITMTEGRDKTVIETDAKWLSADCGAVKPFAPRPAR